jgi:hypothetical protein
MKRCEVQMIIPPANKANKKYEVFKELLSGIKKLPAVFAWIAGILLINEEVSIVC